MDARMRFDFDALMRDLTVVGFVALATWVLSAAVGVIAGLTNISPSATLRFLLAVLILVFARRTYWALCEWRWKKLPPDVRAGFSSPLAEQESMLDRGAEDTMEEGVGFAPATGSSQVEA
jgi:hypothetical protein